jgi:hypothetical protein
MDESCPEARHSNAPIATEYRKMHRKAVLAMKPHTYSLVVHVPTAYRSRRDGLSSTAPSPVIPSNARDLGVCRLGRCSVRRQEPRSLAAFGMTRACGRAALKRRVKHPQSMRALAPVVAFAGSRCAATTMEKIRDQILRIRTPGGPPGGVTAMGNALLSRVAKTSSIASASATCTIGRGEKTLVKRAEACRLTQHRESAGGGDGTGE